MKNLKYLSIFVLAVAAVPAVCGAEGDSDYSYAVDDSGQNYGEQEYGLGSDTGYENSFDNSETNFYEQDSEMTEPAADMTDADVQMDGSVPQGAGGDVQMDGSGFQEVDAALGDGGDVPTGESELSEETVPEDQEMTDSDWAKTEVADENS